MTVDPHLPFKFAGARAVVPFTGRYGHRPPTPDPNALDSDAELEKYFNSVNLRVT